MYAIGRHPNRIKAVTKHGMCQTREYNKYAQAKSRCQCPTNARFSSYGGRGIEFRFTSFEQFFAELGLCPEGKTLDRIDNDGHYEIGNVRWATNEEQYASRRPWKKRCIHGSPPCRCKEGCSSYLCSHGRRPNRCKACEDKPVVSEKGSQERPVQGTMHEDQW